MPAVAVAMLAFGLGACSAYEYVSDKISEPIVLKCPNYWVVADAANVVKFRDGPGRDLTDVNYEGKIVGGQLGCVSHIDRETRTGTMDVDVTIRFRVQRGPANRDRKARFDYFVRFLDNKGTILRLPDKNGNIPKKKDLRVVIKFPGNKTHLQFRTSPFTRVLPISPKSSSSYYRIFVGFKPTREELLYNRKKIQNPNARPSR
mgnify:CR=1 FL=1